MSAPDKQTIPTFRIVRGVMKDLKVTQYSDMVGSLDNKIRGFKDEPRDGTTFLGQKINDCKNGLNHTLKIKIPRVINITTVILIAIFLIVLCILLLITLFKFMKARNMGSLAKAQCGKEYMERETQRYYIYQQYGEIKYQFASINNLLFTCLFIVVVYLGIQSIFIFKAIWEVNSKILEGKKDDSEQLTRISEWFFSKPIYGLFVLFFAASIFSTWIPTNTIWIHNKQLKHNTKMTNRQFHNVLKPLLVFVFVFSFSLLFIYWGFAIKTNTIWVVVALFLIYTAIRLFTDYFTRFHNEVIVPYSKYSGDLNSYLSAYVGGKYGISGKVQSYLKENIKRSHLDINNDPELPKYKEQYYAYVLHNDGGNETFDKGGSSSSINVATFKTNFVDVFNKNPISNHESKFNTQLTAIKYSSNNTAVTTYASEVFNIQLRAYFVDLIYTEDQKSNGYIMGSDIISIIDMYSLPADTANGIKNSFNASKEYRIYDSEYQQLRVGDFGNHSVNRIMNEMSVLNSQQVNDLMNIILLKMNMYDTASINLKSAIKKIEDIKDTLAFENPVSMYSVMERLQKIIEDYMSANISDSKFEIKMSNLRSIDDAMTTNVNKLLNFMFGIIATIFVIISYIIYHKIYHYSEKSKDVVVLWLPLSLIVLIIGVTSYSWISGNLKM